MPMWGKSEQDRLRRVFAYLEDPMGVAGSTRTKVRDWVEGGGPYSAASVSSAMSLGRRPLRGYDKGQREALRCCILARLAAECPRSIETASGWKAGWRSESETTLRATARRYLQRFDRPLPPIPRPRPNPQPALYGADAQQIAAARQALHRPRHRPDPVAKAATVAPTVATSGSRPAVQSARQYFDTVSRSNIVFSGHGSWKVDPSTNQHPFVNLGPRQKMRFYIAHYYPLGNAVGQMVDSNRFPDPVEEVGGGGRICDYTLHHRGELKLLNHSKGDTKFVTVDRDTRLSQLIHHPDYDAVTFHFAACRVVFDATGGKLWCPVHRSWEVYQRGRPSPCVLR